MSSPTLIPLWPREASDKRVVTVSKMLCRSAVSGDIDFVQMARSVNLSPSRLRHLFTIEAGISPLHYVKVLRLHRARSLMLQTFLSVKEVMSESGFNDISHFVREYKRAFGETPSETRRGLSAKIANK
jgi:transcriptional regulator GlxA family with amidase domain